MIQLATKHDDPEMKLSWGERIGFGMASCGNVVDKGTVLLFPSPLIHENTGDRNKRTVPLNYTNWRFHNRRHWSDEFTSDEFK